jgi:hypothetical protein
VRVVIGKDRDGDEISTLVVESVRKTEAATPAAAARAVPRGERLLMTVIDQAIEEAGVSFRPFTNGLTVRGVKDSVARERYYAKIAEPLDDEDREKATARKSKAWRRAIKATLDAKVLMAVPDGEDRLIWKP